MKGINTSSKAWGGVYPLGAMLRLGLLLLCMAMGEWLIGNPFVGAFAYLSVYVIVAALNIGRYADGGFGVMESYRRYTQMRLFATVAIELGVMMMYCRILLLEVNTSMWLKYVAAAGWMALPGIVGWLYFRYASGRFRGQELAEFVLGAVTWVIGDIFLLQTASLWPAILWATVWMLGIVLISMSLYNFNRAFEEVGMVASDRLDAVALERSNRRVGHTASLVSAGVMMLVMLLWMVNGHSVFIGTELPRVLHVTMIQLPVIFMVIALVYAVRQPLDRREREKLMLYIESCTDNERVRASLHHMLVRGHKVSFWSRLLSWVMMPFLCHKVHGKEFLRKGDYPSVFVCNHGFLYGPVVAALFLPTYYRPWIHDRMLREDLAGREIARAFPWVKKVFGQRLGRKIIDLATHLVVKLLLSFRPIAVVRGANHDTMSTFDKSLTALQEGDNLMIFAEKPKHLNTGDNPDLRDLYTGFAHLGKMYYDATGKQLLFYPVFSNQKRRIINIGEPVQYDPSLAPREAKQAVAETLQDSMERLRL